MKASSVPLVVATLALCCLGIEVLNSVTAHHAGLGPEAIRQLEAMMVGLLLMVVLSRIDPWILGRGWIPLYLVGLAGLTLVRVPGIGFISHGARRWISLGVLGEFQPSEPAKLFVVLAVAAMLATRTRSGSPSHRTTLIALLLAAVPSVLICLQPDLGTAVVVMGSVVVLLVVAGAPPAVLLGLGLIACVAVPNLIHSYQRDRVLAYLHPEADPGGIGYNLLQARIAVGAGGTWGRGLFLGAMSQNGFVPENRTDFIFSVIGEELGFVGCVGCIGLSAILLGCVLHTAMSARDRFDMLLATGIGTLLSLHGIINIAMVIGLLPATGVPLPFMSYGGTAVITQMAGLGLVMAVARKQQRANVKQNDEESLHDIGQYAMTG